MSNISPNSLFHFTKEMDYLINIFENGFQPRYNLETLEVRDSDNAKDIKIGIPMTCFCDISLGQINHHVSMYGNYGIGMTKEWAIRNKLNPIIYYNSDSHISELLGNLGRKAYDSKEMLIEKENEVFQIWFRILMFTKPYSGDDVRYYNEREWRYIPKSSNSSGNISTDILNSDLIEDSVILENKNNEMKEHSLSFNANDVKYIFVNNVDEIHELIQSLRRIKGHNYTDKEIDILTSKILTTQQIKEDF